MAVIINIRYLHGEMKLYNNVFTRGLISTAIIPFIASKKEIVFIMWHKVRIFTIKELMCRSGIIYEISIILSTIFENVPKFLKH